MNDTAPIQCTSCLKEKGLSEFHRRGNKTQKICRECRNTEARADYADHGKARTTSPKPINPNNFPVLAERITKLESKLHAKAVSFANDALEADDIHAEMIEAILRKCKPEDTDAFLMKCSDWTAQAYVAKQGTYNHYVETQDLEGDEEVMENNGWHDSETPHEVENWLVQREIAMRFEAVIKSLPRENQKVVAMLSIGMSQREIAGELHVSEQTISERMRKIRKFLSGMEINLEFSFAQ